MAIVFSSCSWLQYVPNSQNVPLFEEKGEVVANMALSTGEQFAGFEMQTAYSFTDNVGLQVNGMVWGGVDNSQGMLFDIAPGYFLNVHDNMVFEVYGGYGKGAIYHTFEQILPSEIIINTEFNTIKYDRYFIQPAIGYTMKNVDLAFSTRLNLIDYYGDKPSYFILEDENIILKELDQLYTIDPAITLRFGWRHIKIQLQTVYLIPFDEKYQLIANEVYPFYEKINFNFGLHFMFGGHFKSNGNKTSGK